MELAIDFGKWLVNLTQEQREYNTVESLFKIYESIKELPRTNK
jgi:uncharacterized protein YeaC (DUF1315 family)